MPQIEIGDDMKSTNGLVGAYQLITSSTHTISATSGPNSGNDYMIGINTNSAKTIYLPVDTARENGRLYYIFDATGGAATYNITIDASQTNDAKINGADTYVINSNYNSVTIVCIDNVNTPKQWIII